MLYIKTYEGFHVYGKILYHGSKFDFDVFDVEKVSINTGNNGHYGKGIYLTEYKSEAKLYGDIIYKCSVNIKNLFKGSDDDYLMLMHKGWYVGDYEKTYIKLESLINLIDNDRYIYFINCYVNNRETYWDVYKEKYNNSFDNINELYDILEYTDIDNNTAIPDYIFDYLSNIFKVDVSKLSYVSKFTYKVPLHYISDLGNQGSELTKDLIELGFDGVYYNGEYVAFYDNQVSIINKEYLI